MTEHAERVDALRAEIRDRQDERARLRSLPRDRATVETIVRNTVAAWHTEGSMHVTRELRKVAAGAAHSLLVQHGLVAPSTAPAPAPFALNLGPMFVALLGNEAVEAALMRFVDETPAGMPARERDARIAEINAELDRLEADEESLIVLAGREGEHIARRRDARPDIICRVVTDTNRREKARSGGVRS